MLKNEGHVNGVAVSASPWTANVTPHFVGEMIVVSIANFYNAGSAGTFGISGGGLTWHQLNASFNIASTIKQVMQSWFAFATSLTTVTVTVTSTGTISAGSCNGFIDEISGADTNQPDNTQTGSGTTGAPTCSLTPVGKDCMLWAFAFASITGAGSGFTISGNDGNGDGTETKVLSGQAGTPQTVNFAGTSGNFSMIAASIRPQIIPPLVIPAIGAGPLKMTSLRL